MIFLTVLALVVAQPTDSSQSTALAPNGNVFLVRVETEGVNGAFNLQDPPGNSSVGGVVIEFRSGSTTGTLVTPTRGQLSTQFIGTTGAPAVTSAGYSALSFPATGFQSSNPTIFLCFNNTILFPGNDRCAQLAPIGQSQLTRNTVTLVQQVGASTQSCTGGQSGAHKRALARCCFCVVDSLFCFFSGSVGVVCNACSLTTTQQQSTFTVVNTVESLTQRECNHAPLFVRGVYSCPVFIQRSNAFTVAPASDQAEIVQLAQSLPPSTDTTTFNNGVTGGFSLPRDVAYTLSVPPAAPVSGANRVYEALITNNGATASVTATDTFFVMFVNAAHRETATATSPPGSFTFANDASGAAIFVEDGLGNVVHYIPQLLQASGPALTPAFVELQTGTYSVNALSHTLAQSTFLGSSVFNASATIGSGVQTQQLTGVANTYVLVVLGTLGDPTTTFGINIFDVTPAATGVQGVAEEQVINMFTASSGGSASGIVSSQTVALVQETPVTTTDGVVQTSCRTLATVPAAQSVTLTPAFNAAFDNSFSNVFVAPSGATCAAITPFNGASALALGDSFTSPACGKRVSLLVGRPYQIVNTVCNGAGVLSGNVCSTSSPSNVTTTEIGNLDFLGSSFFASNSGGTYSVITVDIPSCACAVGTTPSSCPSPSPSPLPTCVCDLSTVTSSLGGLKTNVHNVLTIVRQIQKKVKKH
jgi:hypothetical protein